MSGDVFITFGAETGDLEAAFARARVEVSALSKEMVATAREMQKTGAAADSEMGEKLRSLGSKVAEAKSHVSELKDELKGGGEGDEGGFLAKFQERLEGFTGPLEMLKGNLAEIVELVVAAFAVEKLHEFAEGMAKLGMETQRAATVLGIPTEEVGALKLLGQSVGVELSTIEMAFSTLAKNMETGSKQTKVALATLGLSIEELSGKTTTQQLETLAEAFEKLPAGMLRTATARELLGRAGQNMLPFLAEGVEGIREWQKVAEETGTALDEHMVAAMERTHATLTTMGAAVQGDGIAAFMAFHNVIDGLFQVFADLSESFSKSINESNILKGAIADLDGIIGIVEITVAEVIAIFKDLWDAGDATAESLDAIFTALGVTIREAFAPATEAALAGSALMHGDMKGAAEHAATASKGVDNDKINEAWRASGEHIAEVWRKFHEQETELNAKLSHEIGTITGAQDEHKSAVEKTSEATANLRKNFEEVLGSVKSVGGELDDVAKKIATVAQGLGYLPQIGPNGEIIKGGTAYAPGPPASASDAAALQSRAIDNADVKDLNATFAGALAKAITDAEAATGSKAQIESGYRSTETQAGIYARHQAMPGGLVAHPAAPPGSSLHEGGGAADLESGPVLAWLHEHIGDYPGLEFLKGQTGANDPGHIQIAGGWSGLRGAGGGQVSSPSSEQEDRGIAAWKKLHEEQLKSKESEDGGSAIDKAKLAALDAEVAGKGDALKAQQAIVAATERERDAHVQGEARTKLDADLKRETLKLTQMETAAKEAGLKLDAQRAKGTGNIDAEHGANSKLADMKVSSARGQYGEDSAEYKRAIAEKEAEDQRYAGQKAQIGARQVDEEIRQVHDTANEKRRALDDELAHHQITTAQWLDQTRALGTQEQAELRSLYEKEVELAAQTTDQKIALKNKEADAIRKINQQMADDGRKANDKELGEWESTSGSIVGTFNSALHSMVAGHESFKQVIAKSFEDLGFKFLDIIEKNFVIPWLAGELKRLAGHMTTNAAVVNSDIASGAAGIAAKKATDAAAVTGDAGRAAAGAYAATAEIPVIGPVLAPAAAAAAFAATEAFGSMDIGAWSIPHDQMALVHKNELVMPAAEAGAFRSMLSGAANGGGMGGGTSVSVSPQTHLHVTTMDASTVQSTLRANSGAMLREIDRAVRHGAATGLRRLNTLR